MEYNKNRVGYRVECEAAVAKDGSCIHILSRVEAGPGQETLKEIFNRVRELYASNESLLELAQNVAKLVVSVRARHH